MFFRRFYDDGLAQASYMVGCDGAREVAIVDPGRDVETYIAAAAAERMRITHVTETHIHADFVSGSRELAARTGATLVLSGEGGPDWQYAFAAADGATIVHDGDSFTIGNVRFDVLHTPGHTPEHIAFLVTDLAASDRPVGLLSGDFIFVGDVGRPDLLERAAHVANSMEAAAHQLFQSIQRSRSLPDFVQLWPGHGAGSACGKALGSLPQSTLGYERVANWGLIATDEAAFVREVLAGQPDPPTYFAEMKRINREGPAILGAWPNPEQIAPARLRDALAKGDLVVDTRPSDAFAAGHVPGALNISLGKSFANWSGWLVPENRSVCLVAERREDAASAAGELAKIGRERVTGWFSYAAYAATRNGSEPGRVAVATSGSLAARMAAGDVTIVDVRNDSEWSHGHLAHALHIPLGHLAERVREIPRDRPVVVHCQGGTRSAIAASVLLSEGVRDVLNYRGGFEEWEREGRPVTRD